MKTNLLFVKNGLVVLFLFAAFASNAQTVVQPKINITSFQLMKDQNKVMIKWSTDSASTTNYFIVEKSDDGKNFKTVAYVFGSDPTQKDCECFDCFDKITRKNITSYYRLKHVNTNGIIQFSEVKMLALK
ncbi:MAG: hypothetical protein ABI267_10710 [Ginsengibacter sp.]